LENPMTAFATKPEKLMPIHGFTLVELLVVISVVAILIGMLLPAIQKAKDAAVATVCQSQLRQAFIAFSGYANDRKGKLPSGSSSGCASIYKWSGDYLIAYVSTHASAGGPSFDSTAYRKITSIFYCPVNGPAFGPTWGPDAFGTGAAYNLGYYYLGNPYGLSPPDLYYIDRGSPGLHDDVLYSLASNTHFTNRVVLMVDFSGQSATQNWVSMHPFQRTLTGGRNNALYGDGTVLAIARKDFVPRWYSPIPIGW